MKLVALALAVIGGVARADDAVTLPQALAAAGRAPAVQVAVHELAAAEATAGAASAWPNPAVHLATDRLTARLVAGVSVPLPVFGTVGAARRAAGAEAEVVRAEMALARREVVHRAAVAWIELARAHDDREAQQVAARQAAELETIARGRRDAGTAAEVDVMLAGAARAKAVAAAAAAERLEQAASAELAGLLGWDPRRALRADGAASAGVGEPGLQGRLVQHPEQAAAARRIAAAEAVIDEVHAQRWPAVALEAELDYDDPTIGGATAWARSDARVGVALELPVFARLGDRARAAEATRDAQRAKLVALDAELAGRLAAAYQRWRAAADQLAATEREVLPASERAAELSMQAYREGARDLATALVAERELAAARAERNGLRATAALASVELALASGQEPDAR
ncbi:MAG TPA: TolC family protein [Kofleriaceae bacterium]